MAAGEMGKQATVYAEKLENLETQLTLARKTLDDYTLVEGAENAGKALASRLQKIPRRWAGASIASPTDAKQALSDLQLQRKELKSLEASFWQDLDSLIAALGSAGANPNSHQAILDLKNQTYDQSLILIAPTSRATAYVETCEPLL